jgi:hypothetical protein
MQTSLVLAVVLIAACSGGARDRTPEAPAAASHHHAGDRTDLHGMVLFGNTHHFLEHIPMFSRPHDEQLVMRVTLRDAGGAAIATGFSDTAYSVKPSGTFSLDDLASKRLAGFTGDIYRGNYEDGGTLLLAGAKFTVEDVLIARPLPGSEPIADGEQEYLLVGEPGDAYLTNYIREPRGFQQILRVGTIEGITPSPSRVQRITTKSPSRLAATAAAAFTGPAAKVSLTVAAELWCLRAPEFVKRCP